MTYAVKKVFVTLQGEGMRAGTRAVFVRFIGCNMWSGRQSTRRVGRGACAMWCDTDFVSEWRPKVGLQELVASVCAAWGGCKVDRWVVLTGGEPFLQVDAALVDALRDAGFKVAIETNGTVEPTCQVDWLCCSPKLKADGSVPDLKVCGADELKVVLGGAPDWSGQQLAELESKGHWRNLIVTPLDVRAKTAGIVGLEYDGTEQPLTDVGARRCIEWVMHHPWWRMGYQLHKVVGVE